VEIQHFYPTLNRGIKVQGSPSATGLVIYYQDITDALQVQTAQECEEIGAEGGERGGCRVALRLQLTTAYLALFSGGKAGKNSLCLR